MELFSVIKNDGPADVLFWKFKGEDFNTHSQLIVAENEEALFIRDGIIQETFDGGKYTLETNNYPFITKLRSKISGDVSAFNCKVFFINKTHVLELKWGTDSPIQMRDPQYGIMTSIQARGTYTIQVVNSKKFVLKFVANNTQMTTNDDFNSKFRTVFMQKVKSTIPKAIRETGQEILGVCEKQEEFAEQLTPVMNDVMDEYGIRIVNFYIGALDIPQNDPNRVKLEASFANRAEIGVLGNDWQRIQGRDIMMETAKNEGAAGAVVGAGAGIGVGLAAGSTMGSMANSIFSPLESENNSSSPQNSASSDVTCGSCKTKNKSEAKFCYECGNKLEVKKTFCTNCGTELSNEAKFCNECGTKKEG